jgi:hypothetical protein
MVAKTNTILRNQSGAALVIALIMLVVITLIALASSYTSIFEIKISGNKRGSTDAFYAADAGINAITSYPTFSFPSNQASYTVLVLNTLGYDPSTNVNIPPSVRSLIPTVTPPLTISTAPVKWYMNQSGPPRGGGYSALNVSYTYFQVQCVGSDSAGSGAQTTVQEEVVRLLPVQ